MTQRELARRSGCTRQTIHAIEAAKYGPSLELAFKIAEVFGVPIGDVFHCEVVANGKG
jgi:putative transcriptional regulator